MPRRNYPKRPKRPTRPSSVPAVVKQPTPQQLAQQLVARGIRPRTIVDAVPARSDRSPR